MAIKLSDRCEKFLSDNRQFEFDTLLELAVIPAPSNQEEKRAEWVKKYFDSYGGTQSYIDEHCNVVLPINCDGCDEITVIMAHTDVVQPDTTPYPLKVEDGKICCPGIGDDTANLMALLMVARYILENNLKPEKGLLLVANSGEEGLGNLRGSMGIVNDFAGRIKEFISFDGYYGFVCNDAVGSHRYKVTVKTEGGHSYGAFGNRNAIEKLASMINTLYTMKVPPYGKTTYNVGTIEGGNSVNSIAQWASMLYEYRSDSVESLKIMEKFFESVIESYRAMGLDVEVEVVGKRPCKEGVDEASFEEFVQRIQTICEESTGIRHERGAASTDANSPLSKGVNGVTIGTALGGGAHTREEWITVDCLPVGAKLAMAVTAQYFKEF